MTHEDVPASAPGSPSAHPEPQDPETATAASAPFDENGMPAVSTADDASASEDAGAHQGDRDPGQPDACGPNDEAEARAAWLMARMFGELPHDHVWCRDRGLIGLMRKDRFVPVCGPLRAAVQIRDAVTGNWSVELTFLDRDCLVQREVVLARDLVKSPSAVAARLAERGLDLRARPQALVDLIRAWPTLDRIRATPRPGWICGESEALAYMLPDGRAIGPGRQDLSLTAPSRALRASGSLEGWQAGVGRMASGNPALMLAISAALAGPLLRLAGLDGLGLNFHGGSGPETELLMAAVRSTSGHQEERAAWTAPDLGLERLVTQAHDGLLVLHDFPEVPERELERLIPAFRKKSGGTVPGDVGTGRCVLVSTSSSPIAGHLRPGRPACLGGLTSRLLEVPARSWTHGTLADLQGHTDLRAFTAAMAEAARSHHGHLLPAVVRIVIENEALLSRIWPRMRERICEAVVPDHGSAAVPEGVAHVLEAATLIIMAGTFAARRGLLPWSRGSIARAAIPLLRIWHNARSSQVDDLRHAVEALRRLRDTGAFIDLAPGNPLTIADRPAGWMDAEFIHVDRDVFTSEVARGRCDIAKLLQDARLLEPGGERNSLQFKPPASMGFQRDRVCRIVRTRLDAP
ncbi:DUF927 domain-containing protein [Rhodobacter sp. CZR27]|uniref:DUF927 domain-containing protein n=1 Tax=Rhodobacter sp. CZR27 TaxID=2033869 RepID=UPI000BBE85FF|nr:DUF927 domain-containing protein [Rhodobacter sp. CZR27]